jgi:hypothetical protein
MTEGFSLCLFLTRDLCTNSFNGLSWDFDIFADIEYPERKNSKSYYEIDFIIFAPINAISSGIEERVIYSFF